MIALIPLLIAVIGAVVYIAATKSELKELGRLSFLAGMISLCLYYAGHLVNVFGTR